MYGRFLLPVNPRSEFFQLVGRGAASQGAHHPDKRSLGARAAESCTRVKVAGQNLVDDNADGVTGLAGDGLNLALCCFVHFSAYRYPVFYPLWAANRLAHADIVDETARLRAWNLRPSDSLSGRFRAKVAGVVGRPREDSRVVTRTRSRRAAWAVVSGDRQHVRNDGGSLLELGFAGLREVGRRSAELVCFGVGVKRMRFTAVSKRLVRLWSGCGSLLYHGNHVNWYHGNHATR